MKKLLIFTLSALMLFSAAAGCGGSVTESSQPETSSVSSQTSSAVPASVIGQYDLSEYGNLPSNINNGGRYVFADGDIIYMDLEDKKCICRYDFKTGKHTKLLGKSGEFLNYSDGVLWYAEIITENPGIFSYDLESKKISSVAENTEVDGMLLYKGVLYYFNGEGLYSCAPDGSGKKVLAQGAVNGFSIWDDEIYFIDSENAVRHLLSDGASAVVGEARAKEIVVNNGWIYFTDPDNKNALCKETADGKDLSVLSKFSTGEICIDGNSQTVYYVNFDALRHLTRISPNGEDKEIVNRDKAYLTCMINGYFLFTDANSAQIRILEPGDKAALDFLWY